MYEKIKSSKVSFGLAAKAEQAKKLVQVGGLSEASAEGKSRKIKATVARDTELLARIEIISR